MAAKLSLGSALYISATDSVPTMQKFPGLLSIKWSGPKQNFVDTTDEDNTDGYMTSAPTLKDPGAFQCEANFLGNNAIQQLVKTAYDGQALLYCERRLSNSGGTFGFDAYVESYQVDSDLKEQQKLTFALKVSGPVSYA